MKTKILTKPSKSSKKHLQILKKHSGRDSSGTVSVPHRGGRQKRYYRLVDFERSGEGGSTIVQIEYDPNRSANIALIEDDSGEKRYILHSEGVKPGDKIIAGDKADIKIGNSAKIKNIPLGTEIHNIELYPGRGGQMVKSAGGFATIIAKEGRYADVKMPSKEVRKILVECRATIGRVGYSEHKLEKMGKAGRRRLMGWRPSVRGVAQHPDSHPHGGGEGRSGESMPPKTSTGRSAYGTRTRRKKKSSSKLIVERRK